VAQDRWQGAVEVLDFYHASQHVWALGEALHGQGERARPWVEKQLHQLRHGRHAAVLRTIAGLPAGRGKAGEIIRREQNYFANHAPRMNYRAVADRAGRLVPARWNPPVCNVKVGSNAAANLGRHRVCSTCAP
jgi:hypothetical protein